ncbi:unnamed protein product [Cylicocyclus nassatus]|uniref:Uncharacterized protein n=1 Tax=Cylicocyclus nassatus TaxID=53992 RepID=A0AA36DQY1_CYLNA|nr:unnamed protein product [Cylicocyclus nassatus]
MTHLEKHQADRFYRKFKNDRPDLDELAVNVTYMFKGRGTLPLMAFAAAKYSYNTFSIRALDCGVEPYAIAFMDELLYRLKKNGTTTFNCSLALRAREILSSAPSMTHLEKHQADHFYRKFKNDIPNSYELAVNVTYMFEDTNLTAIGCDYLVRNDTETTFYVYCIVENYLRIQ